MYSNRPDAFDRIERLGVIGLREDATRRLAEIRQILEQLCIRSVPQVPMVPEPEIWGQRGRDRVRIAIRDIERVEADRDYVHIHAGDRPTMLRSTLGALHAQLGHDAFLRIRRSVIVRVDTIAAIRGGRHGAMRAVLVSGQEIVIGRTYLKAVRERTRTVLAKDAS